MKTQIIERTIKKDSSGYNDSYIHTLTIGDVTIETFRSMGVAADSRRWVCAEAVRRGLLTDAEAWLLYTEHTAAPTDGRGTPIERGCDGRPAGYVTA